MSNEQKHFKVGADQEEPRSQEFERTPDGEQVWTDVYETADEVAARHDETREQTVQEHEARYRKMGTTEMLVELIVGNEDGEELAAQLEALSRLYRKEYQLSVSRWRS